LRESRIPSKPGKFDPWARPQPIKRTLGSSTFQAGNLEREQPKSSSSTVAKPWGGKHSSASRESRIAARPASPVRELARDAGVVYRSQSPATRRSTPPSRDVRPGWAGNAHTLTRVSQPSPSKAKLVHRPDMTAKPWREPPPPRAHNGDVMRKVSVGSRPLRYARALCSI
jgi:hypothetical protein